MDLQVTMDERNYCLLTEKPDKDKSIAELERDLIVLFEMSIKKVRASYVTNGIGEQRERP